ncbi:MAG TPA: PepSY domain-containing protein [Eubacteriales bacterium]|nr:PepSY domain-containing protein [Eubacteriales bacterium]
MKRFLIFGLVLVMLFTLAGCGYISSEKAITIALDDLGIGRVETAKTSAELDKESDPVTYKVIIDRNTYCENYIINAATGEIISSETVGK